MSEQNTSDPKTIASGSKVKDPRRVAAGKRLAAISRKAKEEKALRLSQQSDNSESHDKTLYFFAVRYPCFLANQIASFAVRYFTIRTAQPDRCGLQITITKKFKIKYVLKAKNTLTMLKIEK